MSSDDVTAATFEDVEPYDSGMLDVGDGQRVCWEVLGNPRAKPAVVLHGGPGSGCARKYTRFFDLDRHRVVLFDQRGCGRSTPHAGDPGVDLAANTTQHLVADIERLRDHLGIDRWLVFGMSWGSTLGLAYAETHPARVTELVLGMVVTTTRAEVEWLTRDVGRIFPEAWERFRDGVPQALRDGSLVDAYAELLSSDDAAVREQAARDWCAWEAAHVSATRSGQPPDPRYDDPRFQMCFARLVTHYFRHAAFLDDGQLLRDAGSLAGIPGVMAHGRLDLSAPLGVAWALHRAWPGSRLVVVEDAGHSADGGIGDAMTAAVRGFASRRD
ncbi:MAG TPA: prolyl aminopeptidase [Acidimicrobiia bacterium]